MKITAHCNFVILNWLYTNAGQHFGRVNTIKNYVLTAVDPIVRRHFLFYTDYTGK